MKVILAIAIVVATSALAAAQDAGGVNSTGTIGPTVTAKPPSATAHGWRDPDTGDYGVPGGVGDPSVGLNIEGGYSGLRSAPSSLNQRRNQR